MQQAADLMQRQSSPAQAEARTIRQEPLTSPTPRTCRLFIFM